MNSGVLVKKLKYIVCAVVFKVCGLHYVRYLKLKLQEPLTIFFKYRAIITSKNRSIGVLH
jgi:hypothetical protein